MEPGHATPVPLGNPASRYSCDGFQCAADSIVQHLTTTHCKCNLDSAEMPPLSHLSDPQAKEIQAIFSFLDTDNDGILSLRSANRLCELLGFHPDMPLADSPSAMGRDGPDATAGARYE